MKIPTKVKSLFFTVLILFLSFLPSLAQISSIDVKPGINLVAIPLQMGYQDFIQNYGDKVVFIGTYYTRADGKLALESSTPDIVPGKAYLIIAKQPFSIFGQLFPIKTSGAKISTPLYNLELYKVGEEINPTSNETISFKFNISEGNFTQTIETSIPSDYNDQYLALKVKDLTGNELYTYYFTAQNGKEYTVTIPSEKVRETVLVSGTVKDANTGEPLQGVQVCISNSTICSLTDNDGIFKLTYLSGVEVKLNAELAGYTTNQKVVITSSQPITIELKPLTVRAKITLNEGATLRAVGRARLINLNDDKVIVSAPDNSLSITLSKSELSRTLSKRGSGSQTYVLGATLCDPSSEKKVFPGRFIANDPKAFGNRQSSNSTGQIESVAFMDLNLYDSEGNKVDLPVSGMTIRFKIPESLQSKYREAYERGETSIPWYSYNETTGLWEREGDVRLIDVDGKLYGEAEATHFSWWNCDAPVIDHSCLMACVVDKNGNPIKGAKVVAEGISYQGISSPKFTQENGYLNEELRVKRGSRVKIVASYQGVKVEKEIQVKDLMCPYNPSPEQIQKPEELNCIKLFTVRLSGTVYDNATGKPIENAYVYSSTGASAITNDNGKFSFTVAPNQTLKLKVSYTKDNITYFASKEITVFEDDINDADIYIDTVPVCINGTVFLDNGTDIRVLPGTKIVANNGYSGESGEDGTYKICTRKNFGNLHVTFKYFVPDLAAWYSVDKTFKMETDNLTEDVTIKVAKTTVSGCVNDSDGNPVSGAFITSSTGATTKTDSNGKFALTVPADAKIKIYALYEFATAGIKAENSTTVITGDPDTVTPLDCFTLDIKPAYLKGKAVVTGISEVPLPGVKITTSYGFVTTTNSTGEFTVPVKPNSDVNITASFNGITSSKSVTAPNKGETKDIGKFEFGLAQVTSPPVLIKAKIEPRVVRTGEPYTINAIYSDIDSDILTGTCPDGTEKTLSKSGTNFTLVCNGTAENTPGIYQKRLSVEDDQGHKVSTTVTVDIQEDLPPGIISLSVNPKKVKVGTTESVKASVIAYSPDGDSINYLWFLDDKLIDSCNGSSTCDFDVSSLNVGNHSIKVQVVEETQNAKTAEKSQAIDIVSNMKPIVDSLTLSPERVIVPDKLTAIVQAHDPDGSITNYTWYLDNKEISNCTGVNSCSVDISENETGKHTIKVVVTDNDSANTTASAGFEAVKNKCPVIKNLLMSKRTVIPGETLTLIADAEDTDNDVLTYNWLIGNEEVTGKTVQWTAPNEEGTYDVKLTVSDGICSVEKTAKVTVSNLKLSINVDNNVINVGETAHMTYSVSPEGYEVTNATWSLISKPENSSANLKVSGNSASLTADGEGSYTVKLTAYYGSTPLTTTLTITVVNPDNLKVVKGQAVDSNGNPIPGAVVELYNKNDRTVYDEKVVTDSSGYFTFTNVPPGDYYLVVKVDGYEIYSQEVTLMK
ncbi:MAG: hypothetical protein DSZ26_01725 [Thermovibrio sp.]|nr:MAG: hypothetical protein DSZ26_01725 [Thermovibrio sp.]